MEKKNVKACWTFSKDYLDDVAQYPFLVFFFFCVCVFFLFCFFFHVNKKQYHKSIYRADFNKYTKFHKIPLLTHINMEPRKPSFF